MGIACTPCRKRKCKCDFTRPICVQCTIRNSTCSYEVIGDKRRKSYKEYEELQRLITKQRKVLDTISEGGIRSEMMIKHLQEDRTFKEGSIEPDNGIGLVTNLLTSDGKGKISYYGDTSIYSTIKDGQTSSPKTAINKHESPMSVPEDIYLELLSLYFCWQHTYFNILDKDLLLRDMNNGGPYFSDFLFYSILTHAAHLYESNSRTDDQDPVVFGESFYKTAIDMIPQELENPSLTTVQGLLVLASKESGIGKSTLGWIHSGMAFRIAIDLGLHMESSNLKRKGIIDEEEEKVRSATFWGCYMFDQGWSTYLGRPAIIQERDITLQFPEYQHEDSIDWSPLIEESPSPALVVNHYPHNTLTGIISLYRILKNIITDVYSGIEKKDYRNLLLLHDQKLKSWNKNLPEPLTWSEGPMHPAVIMLHTMYYATTIFLYRPFMKLGGTDWKYQDISDPIQVNLECAECILNLLDKYKNLYTLKRIVNLASYVTSTASAVFMSLGTEKKDQLIRCNRIFEDLGSSWPEATLISEIIEKRITKDESTNNNDNNNTANDYNSLFMDFDDFMFGNDIFVDWSIFDS